MCRIKRKFLSIILLMVMFVFIGCETNVNKVNEEISLAKTVLNEVEFENAETVKIDKSSNEYKITGEVEAMTDAQKSVFGLDGVTHVVVIKFVFDKERTIDSFEIKGDITKVYSTEKDVENYIGDISSILDNSEGEDAFCYLILSANTKEYTLTSNYSDSTTSEIKLSIEASLVTAKSE